METLENDFFIHLNVVILIDLMVDWPSEHLPSREKSYFRNHGTENPPKCSNNKNFVAKQPREKGQQADLWLHHTVVTEEDAHYMNRGEMCGQYGDSSAAMCHYDKSYRYKSVNIFCSTKDRTIAPFVSTSWNTKS